MKIKGLVIFIILFFACIQHSRAQFSPREQKQIDSLNTVINIKTNNDTSVVQAYVVLSEMFASSNIDTVIPLCTKAQQIAEKKLAGNPPANVKKALKVSLAAALNNIGYVHMNKVNFQLALEYYHKSLKIEEEIGNIQGLASAYNNIGLIYYNQGDVPLALEYYHKSLKIKEQFGDKKGIAYSLNNIGYVYNSQGDFILALDYYQKSLTIRDEIGDKKGMAMSYNNIGQIYNLQKNTPLALEYFHKSLKLKEEIGDKKGIANSLNNIGTIHNKLGEIPIAMDFYSKALKIREEIGDKEGMANSYSDIGSLKLKQGEVVVAAKYAKMGLILSKEIGFPDVILKTATLLREIAVRQKNWQEAYEMRNLEIQMHDSLASEAAFKAAANQQAKYKYEKEKAITDIEQAKKDALSREENEKQNIIIYSTGAGLFVVLLFLFLLFKRYKVIQKQKEIIQKQKHLVDEKQKEILDSIHYAKRIQMAMLTSEEYVSQHFKAECFILFQPKDVVSGDFYWATAQHNKFYIATADCTGHGVPGAFMSLLNISFLNENVIERKIENPAEILNEQRKEIIKALNPKGNENSKDGMDCVLTAFDLKNLKVEFAAANNPVWLVRSNELIEYKADKMPVGKYEEGAKDFTSQIIDLQKGDIIYTFTDGYADQFGGEKGKKFMYKKLKKLILENCQQPMQEQKEMLSKTINNWKGDNEQVDDILIIGVKI